MQLCIDHEGIVDTTDGYDCSFDRKLERPH